MISLSNGLYRNIFVSVVFIAIGFFLLLLSLNGSPLLLIIALLLISTGSCFTGFDFNTETKMFRKYYRILGIKVGFWKSYEEYCFIMFHPVTLSKAIVAKSDFGLGDRNSPGDTYDYDYTSFKLFLLNKTHSKKLFIKYIDDLTKMHNTAKYLSDNLKMDITKYNPPTTQKRIAGNKMV